MRQQPRSRGTHVAIVAAIAATVGFAVAVPASRASTGSVYFDTNDNAAAGSVLFNGTFTGSSNVGLARQVMPNITTGNNNVAVGDFTLDDDMTGNGNTALGSFALTQTGSSRNTGLGSNALFSNETGISNTAVGSRALFNARASRNIAIGSNAGINLTTGSRNIDIASPGVAGEAGTIRIGTAANQTRAFLAGVWNKRIGGPTKAVVVNSSGRLGTAPKPAAPVSGKLSRMRAENRRQSDQLRQLRSAVQRLREQVQNGG